MNSPVYRVELDLFTGPLDLLLYLVRRDEVDIVDLPIARITQQFHEFLDVLQQLDLDLVGDFVVMASTLVEIKSRSVLPNQNEEPEEQLITGANGDPRSDLIRQLLEYKQFKEAATALEEQALQWQERYPRLADERPAAGKNPAADRIKEVELWDLVSALGRVLKRNDVDAQSTVRYDETPLQTYVEQIGAHVRATGGVPFTSLFDQQTIRSKIIGMFLAVLELIRHHNFRCEQEADFAEIMLLPPVEIETPPEGEAAAPPAESQAEAPQE
ncbi:segregation and condensation protein A [Planctomicrobium sp. SH661]|uniref:segregation and condensation protein A n=1 Tax=Planctomicrobium sp. SH661 TaxID=3448124 RepID=UPI003F5C9A7E